MKNALIMESLGTFFTKDMPVEHLMEVLHDIIADYPLCALESGMSDMRMVLNRVGTLNALYESLRQGISPDNAVQPLVSLMCK